MAVLQDHGHKFHNAYYNCALAVVELFHFMWAEQVRFGAYCKARLCRFDVLHGKVADEEV